MKRKWLLTPLIGLFALAAAVVMPPATTQAWGDVDVGVHAGLNVSEFDRYASEVQTRRGLVVGAYLDHGITPRLAVRAEVSYAEKGGFLGEEWWDRTNITTYNVVCDDRGCHRKYSEVDEPVAYVEVPVLFSVRLLRTPWLRAHVLLGPALGVRVRHDIRFVGDGPPRLDRSIVLGAGADVPLGPGHLRVEPRYTHGLTAIGRYLGRNVAWSFLVGYAYGL